MMMQNTALATVLFVTMMTSDDVFPFVSVKSHFCDPLVTSVSYALWSWEGMRNGGVFGKDGLLISYTNIFKGKD